MYIFTPTNARLQCATVRIAKCNSFEGDGDAGGRGVAGDVVGDVGAVLPEIRLTRQIKVVLEKLGECFVECSQRMRVGL